jgi:hypothetical protein
MEMDQAIREAMKLNEAVGQSGMHTAYAGLENALKQFENDGYPIESIVPGGQSGGLNFSGKSMNGNAFFDVYAKLIRKSLCAKDGEFNKLIKSGLSSSVGAVLTAIVTALGIPLVALGVMVPIAVILTHTGLEAFCAIGEGGEQ